MAKPPPMASLQNTKLQIAIDTARREIGARDILTRSQAELSDLRDAHAVLDDERDAIVAQRDRTAKQIIDLTLLHEALEDQVDDIDTLIAAKRTAIHALEAKGVKMPERQERLEDGSDAVITEGMRAALAPLGGAGK
jgi:chromosome segregation ATPase